MQKKYLGYLTAGSIALVFVLMLGFNVMTAHGEAPFATDKSDRTIIKDILVNQQKTHALLREIKAQLQNLKK